MAQTDKDHPIVFFDGVCNLCDSSVQFIIRRDKKKIFRFASLQGEKGKLILERYHLPLNDFNSFILLDNGIMYTRSGAALRVLKKLGLPWNLFYGLMIIPPFLRNAVYNWIARNRYKWFGQKESCMIPDAKWQERFLD